MKKIHHMAAKKRIAELNELMYGLEMGDDFLFSNRNGNLPTYESWQNEKRELERGLEKPSKPMPYNPQTDTRIGF